MASDDTVEWSPDDRIAIADPKPLHLVEQWRQGTWAVLDSTYSHAASIEFWLGVRERHPDWVVRRITVHETTQ